MASRSEDVQAERARIETIRALFALLLVTTTSHGAGIYAGAVGCRKCHPAEFKKQNSSAHARALGRAAKNQPGEWAFGAGQQAVTFVRRLDADSYLEEGRSWYSDTQSLDTTPGHRNAGGVRYRIYDPSAGILRCFACHSTGSLQLADDEAIVPSELGVRCEACHGPAADHAANPTRIKPRNPGKLTPVQLNQVCGDCHRMPAPAEATPDLRDPWNVRHQPLLLAASACFKNTQQATSRNKLSCLTCHDPHGPLNTITAGYDGVCARCHAAVQHSSAVSGTCVGCHMPVVKPQDHLAFTNHRIAIYSPGDPLAPTR